MNVYDFDKTIYNGDSSIDFFFYCIKEKPVLLLRLPILALGFVECRVGIISKRNYKGIFFSFLNQFENIDLVIENFWREHYSKIKSLYLNNRRNSDVIITASPDFLINPIGRQLGVAVIASEVDKKTGRFISENCKGEQKVKRFKQAYPNSNIENFFTDSYSDLPMMELAENVFIVKGFKVKKYLKTERT